MKDKNHIISIFTEKAFAKLIILLCGIEVGIEEHTST